MDVRYLRPCLAMQRIWTRDGMNWIEVPDGTKEGDVVRWAGAIWKIVDGLRCMSIKEVKSEPKTA